MKRVLSLYRTWVQQVAPPWWKRAVAQTGWSMLDLGDAALTAAYFLQIMKECPECEGSGLDYADGCGEADCCGEPYPCDFCDGEGWI